MKSSAPPTPAERPRWPDLQSLADVVRAYRQFNDGDDDERAAILQWARRRYGKQP